MVVSPGGYKDAFLVERPPAGSTIGVRALIHRTEPPRRRGARSSIACTPRRWRHSRTRRCCSASPPPVRSQSAKARQRLRSNAPEQGAHRRGRSAHEV